MKKNEEDLHDWAMTYEWEIHFNKFLSDKCCADRDTSILDKTAGFIVDLDS